MVKRRRLKKNRAPRSLPEAMHAPDIVTAMKDPNLLGAAFKDLKPWRAWMKFLRVLFAQPLGKKSRAFYRKCTNRTKDPEKQFREAFLVVGRRAGKSRILALVATYLAAFFDWRPFLAPGELGMIIIVAADKKQARTIFNYVYGFLMASPLLAKKVVGKTRSSITLNNGIQIEIGTASYVSIRSYTVVAALFDEAAFWRSEDSANPDVEILKAIRPTLETIPWSMLLVASSPFFKRGIVYESHKEHYGKDDDEVLVWQAATVDMNPTISEERIGKAYKRDPSSAATEWGAQFRTEGETPISDELIDANTPDPSRIMLPWKPGINYVAFTDPSGGSQDPMACAIAHPDTETGYLVLDAVWWKDAPFSPKIATKECAEFIKQYKINFTLGDAYAGKWPGDEFRMHGIAYEVAERHKTDYYSDFIPILNSHGAELLAIELIGQQLTALVRKPTKTGKIVYEHPVNAHDDLGNCVAGALVTAQTLMPNYDPSSAILGRPYATHGEYPGGGVGDGLEPLEGGIDG